MQSTRLDPLRKSCNVWDDKDEETKHIFSLESLKAYKRSATELRCFRRKIIARIYFQKIVLVLKNYVI